MESACHGLEDLLARARDGERRALDAETSQILFAAAMDHDAVARLKDKKSLAASLAAVTARLMASAPAAVPAVPAAPASRRRRPPGRWSAIAAMERPGGRGEARYRPDAQR